MSCKIFMSSKTFYKLLAASSALLFIGTIGAMDCETISNGQAFLQLALSCPALFVGMKKCGLFN